MIADLHAHYPMHVVPEARGSLWQLLTTPLGQARVRDRARALGVGLASRFGNYRSIGSGPRVTIDSMRDGGVRVVLSVLYSFFDELELGERYPAPPKAAYLQTLRRQLETVERDLLERHRDEAVVARTPAELEEAIASDRAAKVVLVHCVEGGFHLGESPQDVDRAVAELAALGVAYITLAHLVWRHVATDAPAIPFLPDRMYRRLFPQPPERGLSDLGRSAIAAMLRERVLLDLSHMSDRALDETFALLDADDPGRQVPVIASHACYRFGTQEYGLSEPTVRRIAERDGVVGLILAQHQLNDGLRRSRTRTFEQSLDVICRHIDRLAEITGSHRHVAIGSDFDGFIKPTMGAIESSADLKRLEAALHERYGDTAGEAIASGNALRLLRGYWGARPATPTGGNTPA